MVGARKAFAALAACALAAAADAGEDPLRTDVFLRNVVPWDYAKHRCNPPTGWRAERRRPQVQARPRAQPGGPQEVCRDPAGAQDVGGSPRARGAGARRLSWPDARSSAGIARIEFDTRPTGVLARRRLVVSGTTGTGRGSTNSSRRTRRFCTSRRVAGLPRASRHTPRRPSSRRSSATKTGRSSSSAPRSPWPNRS